MILKKQSENLWGRAVGQLNQVETDFICRVNKDEDGKIVLSVEQKETNKINTIPAHAEVHLIVRNRLRRQRFSCGTRGELTTPKDELTETAILDAFTTDEHIYGAARWFVKYVEPGGKGQTWAWTRTERLIPSKTIMGDDDGNALLKIATDHDNTIGDRPWQLSFNEKHPTVLVNKASNTLREKLESKSLNEISVLIMPQVCGEVIDELFKEHLTDEVSIDEESWQSRWYNWAKNRVGRELPTNDGEMEADELLQEYQRWKKELINWLNKKLEAAIKVESYLTGENQ